MPARGFANRSRAALGPRPTGTMTGPRGARLTRDRPKRVTPVRQVSGSAVLELSQGWMRSPWRVPQWSAGRRARPDSARRRASQARLQDNRASRRSAPSAYCGGSKKLALSFAKLGRHRAARTLLLIRALRSEIERWKEPSEGRWRGLSESAALIPCRRNLP